jgi:hypothetical protein
LASWGTLLKVSSRESEISGKELRAKRKQKARQASINLRYLVFLDKPSTCGSPELLKRKIQV